MNGQIADPDEYRDATAGTSETEFSREVVFEMLSNQRRRYVVHCLLRREEQLELRELSRQVAAWENGKRSDEVTPEERRRVYNALQQVHLPKMDEAGLIRYDSNRGTVGASEELTDLQIYLEIVPGDEIPWSQYYLLLGLLCASAALAAWLGALPLGDASGVALTAAMALLLTVSGLVHVYYNRKMRIGDSERPPSA